MQTLTKKSAKKTIKKVDPKKNFSIMNRAEKRVAIAKDVIKQLKLKKIVANKGTYIEGADYLSEFTFERGEDMQKQLANPLAKCRVCALGSIMVCDVMKRDNFKVPEYGLSSISDTSIKNKVSSYFSEDTLDMIETAFEKKIINENPITTKIDMDGDCIDGENGYLPNELGKKCIKFGKQFRKDEDRLIAIMKNLIKNKGEFKP